MRDLIQVLAVLIALSSCGDVESVYHIDKDGGIKSEIKFDMSSVLQMFGGEIPQDILDGSDPRSVLFSDTTLTLFQVFESDDEIHELLTEEEINLLKEQELQVHFKPEESLMKIDLRSDYSNQRDLLKTIITVMNLGENKSPEAILPYELMYKSKENSPFFTLTNDQFIMPGHIKTSISNLIILSQAQTTEEQQSMAMMTTLYNSKVVYHLPRPIKSIEGEGWTFIDNRIEFTANLAASIQQPEVTPVLVHFKN